MPGGAFTRPLRLPVASRGQSLAASPSRSGSETVIVDRIFHIAESAAWSEAQSQGAYLHSTLGRTLSQVGFIHCSRRDQVEGVANAVFRGRADVLLLVIDATRVGPDIRYENFDGGDDLFPHLYGPLNLDAVVKVVPFPAGSDGRFTMPELD